MKINYFGALRTTFPKVNYQAQAQEMTNWTIPPKEGNNYILHIPF